MGVDIDVVVDRLAICREVLHCCSLWLLMVVLVIVDGFIYPLDSHTPNRIRE